MVKPDYTWVLRDVLAKPPTFRIPSRDQHTFTLATRSACVCGSSTLVNWSELGTCSQSPQPSFRDFSCSSSRATVCHLLLRDTSLSLVDLTDTTIVTMLQLTPSLCTLVFGLLAFGNHVVRAQNFTDTSACLIAERFIRTMTVREQAAYINTNVFENTTFHAIPEMAITVSNAPTSFDGLTTFRWTEYDTRAVRPAYDPYQVQTPTTAAIMQTVAEPTLVMPTGSPFDAYYILFLDLQPAIAGGALAKRQTGSSVRLPKPRVPLNIPCLSLTDFLPFRPTFQGMEP